MIGLEPELSTAENYARFAEAEAPDRSPRYASWARDVAADDEILAFLHRLPPQRRQPNLLFAAVRHLAGLSADHAALRSVVRDRPAELEHVMRTRRTQTNEPARCAMLLPLLSRLPQPLALLEVGASAGLVLLPDHYAYDYDGHAVTATPPDPAAPVMRTHPYGPVPLPAAVPRVAWRAGLDLAPLDVSEQDDTDWLRALVWPGETEREHQLEAALRVAQHWRPPVHRGDLVTDLTALAEHAPRDATLVIMHSAVLAYTNPRQRHAFTAVVDDLRQRRGAHWIANDSPAALRHIVDPIPDAPDSSFVLALDGRPVAHTDGHATWLRWLGEDRS